MRRSQETPGVNPVPKHHARPPQAKGRESLERSRYPESAVVRTLPPDGDRDRSDGDTDSRYVARLLGPTSRGDRADRLLRHLLARRDQTPEPSLIVRYKNQSGDGFQVKRKYS